MAYDEAIGVAGFRFVGVGAHAMPPLPPPVATSRTCSGVALSRCGNATLQQETPPDGGICMAASAQPPPGPGLDLVNGFDGLSTD